jgi:hypothetical protein
MVVDEWVAWVSDLPDESTRFERLDLIHHHEIVSQIHARADACLPARFPTCLADEAALRREIERRAAALSAALERVRGRSELAVTGVWLAGLAGGAPQAASHNDTEGPGTHYLLARQRAIAGSDRRRARATEIAAETEALAGDLLVAAHRTVCPSPRLAFSSALLVPRDAAGGLSSRLSRAREDVRILVNGPWPPYTFANVW